MRAGLIAHNPADASLYQARSKNSVKPSSTFRNPLPYDSGDAAWLTNRPGDVILEIANCQRAEIARAHIGPSAATFLGLTRGLAALAVRVGRHLEVPVVAAVAIDAELDRSVARFDDAGPAHAGYAACRCDPRHDPGLEPANGVGTFSDWIGKSPGAAARIPLAARGALGGIAGPRGKAGIIAARPIKSDLAPGRRAEDGWRDQQTKAQPKPSSPHSRPFAHAAPRSGAC
jgi:hypothetical protein